MLLMFVPALPLRQRWSSPTLAALAHYLRQLL
jgi:hypothetical protein